MLNMQQAALRDALEELDQATQDHVEWHADLVRAIVCRLPCDPDDLVPGAHRHCRFGQWYYGRVAHALGNLPYFAGIGVVHEQVHKVATEILREISVGLPVNRAAFDEFTAGSLRLRGEIDRIRRELLMELRARDTLTGAYDRDHVLPELRRWREAANPGAASYCVVLMDLDHLREVNEAQGHAIGDALLVDAVHFLREHLRPDDKVFRYGGDEFLITLPGADLDTARVVVGRIRDGLARRELFVAGARSVLHTTASFGLALLDPEARVEDAIEQAAQALLLAKTAGGNRAISWDALATTGRHWRRLEVDALTCAIGEVVRPE